MATDQVQQSPHSDVNEKNVSAKQMELRERAAAVRRKWWRFLVLGLVLMTAGALAIIVPEVSTFAAGTVFGVLLALAGIVKMILSLQTKEWSGFIWQELTGAAEVVGGVLIYFNPLKGALAFTLLLALVLVVQAFLQLALAARIRRQDGWWWFIFSGMVSLCAAIVLMAKIRYTIAFEPGEIAGITLLVAGIAYTAIAFAMRRSRQE